MNLKESFESQKLSLKNRLVYPSTACYLADEKGHVTPELLAHYRELVESKQMGLVMIEHTFVRPDGRAGLKQLGAYDDSCIEGLKQLAETIHAAGAKTVLQISHAGSRAIRPEGETWPIVGPVSVHEEREEGEDFHVEGLSFLEVRQLVTDYQSAAWRAYRAGFDGVEIHCAHGYLLNQFYSPLTNIRDDEYGGTTEKRILFTVEVVEACRRALGKRFPIFVRLGAEDYMEGGNGLREGAEAALRLEGAGADVLDISGGLCGYIRKDEKAPKIGYFADAAAPIKDLLKIPVMLTGGITTEEQANRFLEKGYADLIGMSRGMKNFQWEA